MVQRLIQAIGLMLLSVAASAAPILDQSHNPASTTSSSSVFGAIQQAQTFTVGLSGILTRFDILGSGGNANLMLDILGTSGGLPNNADVRQTVSVGALASGGFTNIALSTSVTAGEVLAAVFYQGGGTAVGTSLFGVGSPTDQNSGGGLWTSGNPCCAGGGWYPNGNSTTTELDLAFQTWVDDGTTVPAPAAAFILALGLAGIALRRNS